MTNASSISVRDRTSRLDRSMASSLRSSSREDDSGELGGRRLPPGGRLPTLKRDEPLKVYDAADEAHDGELSPTGEQANEADDDSGVQREDSGGSGSTVQQQQQQHQHQAAGKSQMDRGGSVASVPAVIETSSRSKGHYGHHAPLHRSKRVQQQQSKETVGQQPSKSDQHQQQQHQQQQQQQLPWGRNIEEGISGILKRLDQLAISTNDAGDNNKKGGASNAIRPGLLAGQQQQQQQQQQQTGGVHRDITSERLHYAKERSKWSQRVEELERVVERLTNENRQWKARHDDLVAENRQLKMVKYPIDELKSRTSVVLTDLKGRPSVVLGDQNGKRGDAGWLSLWNVLPHVGPLVGLPNGEANSGFQPPQPEILLRCLQINLQHKKKAMERTKRMLVDRNIDIAIIQEPYAIGSSNPEVMGVPTGYTAYHNLTEHHPNGAAVIAKNSLRAKLCHYGRNDVAGIMVRSGNKTYHFYSVFCRPTALNLSTILLPILEQAPSTLVVGMDASAKHTKWNNGMVYRKIDQRGRELERLLDQYDLHLASPPLYKLKYIPENYSFIDVTLGGENIQFHDWKFWEDSLSDHPYIFFQVE